MIWSLVNPVFIFLNYEKIYAILSKIEENNSNF